MSDATIPPDVLATLSRVFGFAALRPGQAEVVAAVLAREDVLAVMPTGAGKSLCYQLPALVGRKLTIVVSPLIALMRDQVGALRTKGVAAGALHSGLSRDEASATLAALRNGQLRLLYVSPERLVRPQTIDLLRAAGCDRLAVDEAHCVSQWGHDFRPDYLGLRAVAAALGEPPILAVTASADRQTRREIVRRLFVRTPREFVRSFDRPNLHLAIQRKSEVARQIKGFLRAHKGQSGIVYAASRKGVEAITELLAKEGVWALPYHAGLETSQRHAHQDEFLRHPGVVIVATIAFGMGIDKPDVRFVCHADLPGSIEGYYQEIGRAGRDGARADTLLLWGEGDIRLRERQIALSESDAARKAMERRRLEALTLLCESPRCRRQSLLAAFGEPAPPCGFCDICDGVHPMIDGMVAAQKAMSALLRTSGRFLPGHLANLLVGNATDAIRRQGHDQLPTFGIGRERSAAAWRSIFRQIAAADLIERGDEEGRWHVTSAGRAILSGQATLPLIATELVAPTREAPNETGAAQEPALTSDDQRLFAKLKAKRLEIARSRRLPPYTVLTDRSLRAIAQTRPSDEAELAALHGIGPAKIASYGKIILEIVREHQD